MLAVDKVIEKARRIAAELRIARARNRRLAVRAHCVIPPISLVRLRAFALVPRPINLHLISMLFHVPDQFCIILLLTERCGRHGA